MPEGTVLPLMGSRHWDSGMTADPIGHVMIKLCLWMPSLLQLDVMAEGQSLTLLEPPMDLLATIFPWVEAEEAALKAHVATEPLSKDMALSKFLSLMKWLQMVIIQDAAILQHELPDSALWGHMPFNTV
ncbi:hypothetical protein FRB95_001914 [Tulasnella sp. JGI-2019a]|nr:hypothetical protein FRB95_001914 [Tulasnella sp. JGI-2019a]